MKTDLKIEFNPKYTLEERAVSPTPRANWERKADGIFTRWNGMDLKVEFDPKYFAEANSNREYNYDILIKKTNTAISLASRAWQVARGLAKIFGKDCAAFYVNGEKIKPGPL